MIIYLKVRDSSNEQSTYHLYANNFCISFSYVYLYFRYTWFNYDLCFSRTKNQVIMKIIYIYKLHLPKSYNALKQA